jgi:hypothetical protein
MYNESKLDQLINKHEIEETFTINTFGFGDDHDATLMASIARKKGGSF